MEKETALTPRQSLDLIASMIVHTREHLRSHSFIFLLWGWALVAASVLRFILQTQTHFRYYFLPFPVLVGAALLITAIRHRPANSQTQISFYLKSLWTVLAAGFIAVVAASVYQKVAPFSYTMILAAIGTAVTGLVLRFKPLIGGGIVFGVCSIASLALADEYKVLLHAAAIVFGYLIPGYLLKRSNG